MVVDKSDSFEARGEDDVVRVRQMARSWATERGLGLVDQTKVVTAASELARNMIVYGGGGVVMFEALQDNGRKGLRLTFQDRGPGIADIQQAMKDGFTTGSGLGLGLSGARRLSNDFHIESEPGKGTTIAITRWKS